MDRDFALAFVDGWEAAWNSHDIDRILSHYVDDVVFQSPFSPMSPSEVHGKEELRSYWTLALERQPDLRFTVEDVRVSVDTIVINYGNQNGHAVSEVLRFRGQLVCWGCAAYLRQPAAVDRDRC